jgi:hypothetical protein
MRCFCCEDEIALARKAKLRPWLDLQPAADGSIDPAAYAF